VADAPFVVPNLNLDTAERELVLEALSRAGTIHGAAQMLGTTRHGVKRRIIKHRIMWPRETCAARMPESGTRIDGGVDMPEARALMTPEYDGVFRPPPPRLTECRRCLGQTEATAFDANGCAHCKAPGVGHA